MITFRPVVAVPDLEPDRCAYREADARTGLLVRCERRAVYTVHGFPICKEHRDRPSGVLWREVVPVDEHRREQG